MATVLGRKFISAGHQIVQVLGRNAEAASALAYEWDTESATYMTVLNKNADVYLIAVSDNAIASIVDNLRLPGKVVAHTAASVPKEVLQRVSDHYGVFYPLQSLRKNMIKLPDIPVYFDGNDEVARKKLEALAGSMSYHLPVPASDDQRLKLHVAAVLVSNFVNHLYVLAEDYCKKEGLGFKQLVPLIEETALRIKDIPPRQAQTGPAIRFDKETLHKHLELLNDHPQLKNIYLLLTESIQQV